MINKKQVKKYCYEDVSLIENYDKAVDDAEQTWDCHHRLEIQDDKVMSPDALKKAGLYYNRPASELVFLTHYEHNQLHRKGVHFSEETKQKMSKARKGRKFSEETIQKMSEAKKGKQLTEETKQKMSETHKGENNPMYGKHFSEETKQKMRDAWKKRKTMKASINTIYKIKNNNNETISNNI